MLDSTQIFHFFCNYNNTGGSIKNEPCVESECGECGILLPVEQLIFSSDCRKLTTITCVKLIVSVKTSL